MFTKYYNIFFSVFGQRPSFLFILNHHEDEQDVLDINPTVILPIYSTYATMPNETCFVLIQINTCFMEHGLHNVDLIHDVLDISLLS
jgi:hypothetical protein